MSRGIDLLVVFVEHKSGRIVQSEIGSFGQNIKVEAGCDPGNVIRYFIGWRKVNIVIVRLTH